MAQLAKDGASIVALLRSHPEDIFAHNAEKVLGSILITQHGSSSDRSQQEATVSPNRDDNQGGDMPTMDFSNAFLEGIFDFPYFGTSDWSFDPSDLENIELN